MRRQTRNFGLWLARIVIALEALVLVGLTQALIIMLTEEECLGDLPRHHLPLAKACMRHNLADLSLWLGPRLVLLAVAAGLAFGVAIWNAHSLARYAAEIQLDAVYEWELRTKYKPVMAWPIVFIVIELFGLAMVYNNGFVQY